MLRTLVSLKFGERAYDVPNPECIVYIAHFVKIGEDLTMTFHNKWMPRNGEIFFYLPPSLLATQIML